MADHQHHTRDLSGYASETTVGLMDLVRLLAKQAAREAYMRAQETETSDRNRARLEEADEAQD